MEVYPITKVLFGTTFSLFYTHTSLRTTKISGIAYFDYRSPYCLVFLRHMERISPLVARLQIAKQFVNLDSNVQNGLYSLYRFPLGTTRTRSYLLVIDQV